MKTLLAIADRGQRGYSRWWLQQLMLGMVMMVMLFMAATIVVSSALVSIGVAAYFVLIQHGLSSRMAIIIIAIATISSIVVFIALALSWLHSMRPVRQPLLKPSPLTSRAITMPNRFHASLGQIRKHTIHDIF